jgi:hypothetical protein
MNNETDVVFPVASTCIVLLLIPTNSRFSSYQPSSSSIFWRPSTALWRRASLFRLEVRTVLFRLLSRTTEPLNPAILDAPSTRKWQTTWRTTFLRDIIGTCLSVAAFWIYHIRSAISKLRVLPDDNGRHPLTLGLARNKLGFPQPRSKKIALMRVSHSLNSIDPW